VLVRIGNGAGLVVNDPVHTALLADYYLPESRPEAFSVHRSAPRIGAILGPIVAGIVGFTMGWRAAFFVMAIPIVIVAVVSLKLKEPVRGGTDDPELALEAAQEAPVSFARGYRILRSVPTLRRQYLGAVFLGAAFVPLVTLLTLYLDRVFHIGQVGRGVVGCLNAAAGFAGVIWAGRLTRDKWLKKSLGEPQRQGGIIIILVAVGLLVISALAKIWLVVPIGMAVSFVGGMYLPPVLTVTAMVSPARVRSQGFSMFLLFLALGGFNVIFTGPISDNHGIRWAIAYLTPWWIVAGLVIMSASKFVEHDAARAMQNLLTTAQLRRQRLSAGERSLLLCSGIDVAYGQTQVLFGVNFEVQEGEMVALLGTNGAGKSTLLKAICGSVVASGGTTFYEGKDLTGVGAPEATANGIVLVPGGKGVFPGLSVAENLELAAWLTGKDTEFLAEARERALNYFPVLQDRMAQKAGNLSGGEQQMLTIAMALLTRPKLLMIDELSLGLAPVVVEKLLEVVKQINEDGVTIILVEQSVNVALTLADRAVFMEKGEVRFDGATKDLLERPDILRSVFLEGASAVSDGNGNGNGNGGKKKDSLKVKEFVLPTDMKGEPLPPLLEVRSLSVNFGGIRAVNDVTFQIHKGQILGLIGPNGAGKTTIFDLISGFLVPSEGSVILDSRDVTRFGPDRRSRMGLGRSFQDARLFPSMTVKEVIATALERHIDSRDPLAAMLASPATRISEEKIDEKVAELIELMHLEAFRDKFISELSTGSRRVVDLACTLAHGPKVLLLDEPSSGIAQRETEALGPLLLDIRDRTGAALIVIEHDMPLITTISDDMIALELGTIITQGRPGDVVSHPRVVASYLGTSEEVINRSGELAPDASTSGVAVALLEEAMVEHKTSIGDIDLEEAFAPHHATDSQPDPPVDPHRDTVSLELDLGSLEDVPKPKRRRRKNGDA
jgi:branched-chain amino acid transport system ATP-binding protein